MQEGLREGSIRVEDEELLALVQEKETFMTAVTGCHEGHVTKIYRKVRPLLAVLLAFNSLLARCIHLRYNVSVPLPPLSSSNAPWPPPSPPPYT